MENLKRAYRRHKKITKFVKRVKKYFSSVENKEECIAKAMSGKRFTFLRTTGRPCNCEMCTYKKYKRKPKHEAINDALKE